MINVTPDSFSDGGVHLHPEAAITAARAMLDDGRGDGRRRRRVDPPGLGRRPARRGARARPAGARGARGRAALDRHRQGGGRRPALALGVELVNDVTALRGDPELAGVVAGAGAYLCLMHMRGEPATMQDDPRYDDVVSEVKAFLEERLAFAVSQGMREELVCLDPGIGFGKTVAHNFELVRRLHELVALGRPLMIGFSRKSSLGRIMGDPAATTGHDRRPRVGVAVAAFDRGATPHPRPRRPRARRGARGAGGGRRVRSSCAGSSSTAITASARRSGSAGQRFVYDVELEVGERGADDRIEHAVDYREVAACLREVAGGQFRLLEALASRDRRRAVERFRARAGQGAGAQAGGAPRPASRSTSAPSRSSGAR